MDNVKTNSIFPGHVFNFISKLPHAKIDLNNRNKSINNINFLIKICLFVQIGLKITLLKRYR